jgi:Flp pilus assembly pilin Flp
VQIFRRKAAGAVSSTHRVRTRRGQTLVEYAIIIALIAVVAIGVLISLGNQTKGFYSFVSSQVAKAAGS